MEPDTLMPIIAALAGLAWMVALGSWVLGLQHLSEGTTKGQMLTQGMKAFDASKYTEEGQAHYRRFKKAFGAFFLVCILGAIALVIAASASEPPPLVG